MGSQQIRRMNLTTERMWEKGQRGSRLQQEDRNPDRGMAPRKQTKIEEAAGRAQEGRTSSLQSILRQENYSKYAKLTQHRSLFSIQPFFYMPTNFPYYALLPLTPISPDPASPTADLSYSFNGPFVMHSPESFYSPKHFVPVIPDSPSHFPMHQESQPEISPEQLIDGSLSPRKPLALIPTGQSLKNNHKQLPKLQEQSLAAPLWRQKGDSRSLVQANKRDHEEYLPQMDRQRKSTLRYQVNENRNVIPNEINQIFSFVQKQNKSGPLLAKIMKKYPAPLESCSIKRFYLYQGLLKNRLGHYSNQKSLKVVNELYEPRCENWCEQEQRYYNKLCRILIHHFLMEDSIFIILTSKRMKQSKKRDHLLARRHIRERVTDILRGL